MEIKKYEDENRIITYYVGGNISSDKILVFLNGLYVGNKSWIKQQRYKYFSNNYKMIFIDYPGMGKSIEKKNQSYTFDDIVEFIRRILDKENCKKFNLVGYSIGGMISLWFIHKFSNYIEKLILINTGSSMDEKTTNNINGIIESLSNNEDLDKIFRKVYPWNHSDQYLEKLANIEDSVIENYISYNKDANTLIKFFYAIGNKSDLKVTLKDIKVPTLIIGSDQDKIFPYIHQKNLAHNIKNSKCYMVKNCGHSSCVEQYIKVNELIENHLKN